MQTNPTPTLLRAFWRVLFSATLGVATGASGQTPARPPASQPATSSQEAIVLSPFEVTTEKDTGFVAAGSLAGGRLAGELRDTPVAYSVITREFIDALEITDLLQATTWS
ncbi:MAG: hypothetical protein ACREH8_19725, partial [Opitutaceae bacterium]